jgi:hypothetical protein
MDGGVMSEECYEVVFRGDVLAGQSVMEVKQRLTRIFKTDVEHIDKMFSGRPFVVKSNLNQKTAEHYKSSMLKAGALVDVRLVGDKVSTVITVDHDLSVQPQSQTEALEDTGVDVAPVGSDVLAPEDKKDFAPVDIDTSFLAVAGAGTDILADEDKKEFVPLDVDTSSLSIDDFE